METNTIPPKFDRKNPVPDAVVYFFLYAHDVQITEGTIRWVGKFDKSTWTVCVETYGKELHIKQTDQLYPTKVEAILHRAQKLQGDASSQLATAAKLFQDAGRVLNQPPVQP
jgi:hypothetical protein